MLATFNQFAEAELNDAIGYYETELAGLGAAFLAEIRRSTAAIVEYPEANPIVSCTVRRRLCERFPYALLYQHQVDQIRILAVMHLKRRPSYWIGRR